MKFLVTAELMQKILDFIGNSTSTMPTLKVVNLVDEIRALKPVPQEEGIPKEAVENEKESQG